MRDLGEDIADRVDLQPAFTRRRLITTRDDPSRPLLVVFEHRSSSRPRHPRTRKAVTMPPFTSPLPPTSAPQRSEEHTSELQSRGHLVCRLLLEKTKTPR